MSARTHFIPAGEAQPVADFVEAITGAIFPPELFAERFVANVDSSLRSSGEVEAADAVLAYFEEQLR